MHQTTETRHNECSDPPLLNEWHVVADASTIAVGDSSETTLLGVDIVIEHHPSSFTVRQKKSGISIHNACKYGFLWACLGQPAREILDVPEADEPDRYLVCGGSVRINVSGLRVVENFLDMGHFPFVHTNWLGVEPHTEVPAYKVELTPDDEILATECKFFQPVASPTATDGLMVDYVYRVIRPYIVALYKTNPVEPTRMDSIHLFVQPIDEEHSVAHPFLCYLKHDIDAATIRWFMQLIFSQDKPILENQLPKRLPLDPLAETPIRADAASINYRRWLRNHNITYGAIPAAA